MPLTKKQNKIAIHLRDSKLEKCEMGMINPKETHQEPPQIQGKGVKPPTSPVKKSSQAEKIISRRMEKNIPRIRL